MLIGIAGLSGSGKTTLARALLEKLPDSALFSLDAYYKPLSGMPVEARKRVNFDHPDAIDWPLAVEHLDELAAGRAVEVPVYNFATHDREPRTQPCGPARYVLVEGLLALWHDGVRSRLGLKVFVDTPNEKCLDRRITRDMVERQRIYEEVLDQWNSTVHPMAEQYILPSRAHADLVVNGQAALAKLVPAVTGALADLQLVKE